MRGAVQGRCMWQHAVPMWQHAMSMWQHTCLVKNSFERRPPSTSFLGGLPSTRAQLHMHVQVCMHVHIYVHELLGWPSRQLKYERELALASASP